MSKGASYTSRSAAQESVRTVRSSDSAFNYSETVREEPPDEMKPHPKMDINGKRRECCETDQHPEITAITVASDITESRGEDPKTIFEQMDTFLGSLYLNDDVSNPQVQMCAFGDAESDRVPIQVGQWESDQKTADDLRRFVIEEGGGGTGEESSDLMAYYLANCTDVDPADKRGDKALSFILTDEAPHDRTHRDHLKEFLGISSRRHIPTEETFAKLSERFEPFVIFPASSMEDRIAGIDREIAQRLNREGGEFKNAAIRFSLIWETYDDLDLHAVVRTDRGTDHIYYQDPRGSYSGGELDVDMNASDSRRSNKPVENIRWLREQPATGTYEVYVENFCFWRSSSGGIPFSSYKTGDSIPFKIEIAVPGHVYTFKGETPANSLNSESRVKVCSFKYNAKGGVSQFESSLKGDKTSTELILDENHAAYETDVILGKWHNYLPAQRILQVQDPKNIVECMIAVTAMLKGKNTLEQVEKDMKRRKVSKRRRDDVLNALCKFTGSESKAFTPSFLLCD